MPTELDALSPLDGRYRNKVEELASFESEAALIRTRAEVEAKYLVALSEEGIVRPLSGQERVYLLTFGQNLTTHQILRIKEIETTTRHDVKAVERGLREILSDTSLADLIEYIHLALTSEDINNLAYRLMAQRAKDEVCIPTIDTLTDKLVDLADSTKGIVMIGRTHGQAAVPTTLGKELSVFASRLNRQTRQLSGMKLTGKINGAVGNYNAHRYAFPDVDWEGFSERFVSSLGLEPNLITTQINSYDDFVEMFHAFLRINGIIIGLDQDIWRYISDGWLGQEVRAGEVGSSTMPQKVNPIMFENSEGNLALANTLFGGMAEKLMQSRLQRDLSDSTTIRNVGTGMGYSVLAYQSTLSGLNRITPHRANIHQALHANWAVLSEGVQVLLRTKGINDPYSLIAALTRGESIGAEAWSEWVSGLPGDIDDITRTKLAELTPETYVGDAVALTERAVAQIAQSSGMLK